VALGVTAVPNLLLRYDGRLKLTSNEIIYLQHVLLHRWEEAWSWVPVGTIVEAIGAAERSVRDWKASLVTKGLLNIRAGGRSGGGRGADEHDLPPLFARLEAHALEDELQRAADQVHKRLPSPTYYRDWTSVPGLPVQGVRKLQTRRVQAHSRRTGQGAGFSAHVILEASEFAWCGADAHFKSNDQWPLPNDYVVLAPWRGRLAFARYFDTEWNNNGLRGRLIHRSGRSFCRSTHDAARSNPTTP
jgi:hypothetical protein